MDLSQIGAVDYLMVLFKKMFIQEHLPIVTENNHSISSDTSPKAMNTQLEHFKALFKNMSEGFAVHELILDAQDCAVDYLFLDVNPAFERLTNFKRQELVGNLASKVLPCLNDKHMQVYRQVVLTGETAYIDYYCDTLNKWYQVFVYRPVTGQFAVIFTDVSELKQTEKKLLKLNRTLQAFTASTHALLKATDELSLLQEICQIITQSCGYSMTWIGFAEYDEVKSVRPVAQAGFDLNYLQRVVSTITWADNENGLGPTGTAIRTGQTVICRNILADPKYIPWREYAIKAGYASSMALPLKMAQKVFGVINIYSSETDPFTEDEINLLNKLADDVGYGISTLRIRAAHKQVEAQLYESISQYRTLLSNIPGAAYRCELQPPWRIEFISAGVETLTGYTSEQFQQTLITWADLIIPEDFTLVATKVAEAIDHQTPYEIEYRIRHREGSIRWVCERGGAVYDLTTHEPLHLDGVIVDISAHKQAEEARRESETRFQIMANAAPVMIWLADNKKHFVWFNQQWLSFTGRSLQQELNFGWLDSIHPDDKDSYLTTYTNHINEQTSFEAEYRLRRADGQYRWILNRGIARFCANGEFLGHVGSCVDITDHKHTLDDLREADQYKNEFIATLAHELRNPLAPLNSSLHSLRRLPSNHNEATNQLYSMMERQINHLVHLVDDLLEVSRITQGKIELQKEKIDLVTCIHNAVEMVNPLIEAANHQFTLNLCSTPLPLEADPVRLAQVLTNLLNNAAKYTGNNGYICLSTRREGNEALISIQDNGVGIPANMLPYVFDMFAQVHHTQRRSQSGLGIGLTLAQKLIQMHGGRIEAYSDGLGKGSEFRVYLPLQVSTVTELPSNILQKPAEEVSHQMNQRILIVDDNHDVADSLGMLLELMGYGIKIVYNGMAALESLTTYKPSLVLLDVGMPGMDGYEVARQIRQQSVYQSLPLIALTGWGQEEDRKRTKEAGFDYHMVKPVNPDELESILNLLSQQKTLPPTA